MVTKDHLLTVYLELITSNAYKSSAFLYSPSPFFNVIIYIFLYCVSINQLLQFYYVFLLTFMRELCDLSTIITLEYSEFNYIFAFTSDVYTFKCFMLLISVLSFYLEELSLTFLVRDSGVMNSFSFCLSGKCFISPSILRTMLLDKVLLVGVVVFFFQHFKYIIPFLSGLQCF